MVTSENCDTASRTEGFKICIFWSFGTVKCTTSTSTAFNTSFTERKGAAGVAQSVQRLRLWAGRPGLNSR